MKKTLYKLWSKFLTAFGNIRLSKCFPWIYYDTVDYKVTGENILEIMDVIQEGDIILRGYDSYLDGLFIPDPLSYSHGAIYIGDNQVIHAIAEGVSYINMIDFCQCDRIAIFHPKKSQKKAIKLAKKYIGTDYDFNFELHNNSIYCFELCQLCYPSLKINPCKIKKLFGLITKESYLAESFFKSKDMTLIYQYNPKYNINYIKEK